MRICKDGCREWFSSLCKYKIAWRSKSVEDKIRQSVWNRMEMKFTVWARHCSCMNEAGEKWDKVERSSVLAYHVTIAWRVFFDQWKCNIAYEKCNETRKVTMKVTKFC